MVHKDVGGVKRVSGYGPEVGGVVGEERVQMGGGGEVSPRITTLWKHEAKSILQREDPGESRRIDPKKEKKEDGIHKPFQVNQKLIMGVHLYTIYDHCT